MSKARPQGDPEETNDGFRDRGGRPQAARREGACGASGRAAPARLPVARHECTAMITQDREEARAS